jgi:hypothetical protein
VRSCSAGLPCHVHTRLLGGCLPSLPSYVLPITAAECSSTASEEGSPSSSFRDTSESEEDRGELAGGCLQADP